MAMGLSEAAAATGVNRSTIYRAWKSGRMSATRTDTGQIEVDAAELFRVFPPVAAQETERSASPYGAQATATDNNALRARALEVEVKLLREMLDAMREDRNALREQASKVVAALPLPITTVPDQRRSWCGDRWLVERTVRDACDRDPPRPETYLQAAAGSKRHFSLVKILLWAQSQPR